MDMNRGEVCRQMAEQSDSANERTAWLAAGCAWDSLQIPKPPLSARGRQLASLYAMTRLLATVESAEPKPDAPTSSPKAPEPEPIKPNLKGAFATIEF